MKAIQGAAIGTVAVVLVVALKLGLDSARTSVESYIGNQEYKETIRRVAHTRQEMMAQREAPSHLLEDLRIDPKHLTQQDMDRLDAMLEDPALDQRIRANNALVALADARGFFPLLETSVQYPDDGIHCSSAQAVAEALPNEIGAELLITVLEEKRLTLDPSCKSALDSQLFQMWGSNERLLLQLLENHRTSVVIFALKHLGEVPPTEVDAIRKLLAHPDATVRLLAGKWLNRHAAMDVRGRTLRYIPPDIALDSPTP